MKLKMKNKYVLTKEILEDNRTPSGLYLPRTSYNRKCIILEADKELVVKKGDVVIKKIGKGTIITLNDEELEFLHINDIMAVLKDYVT